MTKAPRGPDEPTPIRTIQRSADIFPTQLDGSVLLLNADTGCYHGLNPVGSRIWELLAEPIEETRLVACLISEFAVEADECERQVKVFIEQLRTRGLLMTA